MDGFASRPLTPLAARCQPQDALVIGAKLDADMHGESCRLAFYGRLVCIVDQTIPEGLSKLRVYKVSMNAKQDCGQLAGVSYSGRH